MAGLSPKLPILRDSADGYALTKTYPEMVSQNLKNLLLTVPGERMMDPLFGVGLKRFLFEQHSIQVYATIHATLLDQVSRYMPFIDIFDVEFFGPEEVWSSARGSGPPPAAEADLNTLQMKIHFTIVPLAEQATLELDIQV